VAKQCLVSGLYEHRTLRARSTHIFPCYRYPATAQLALGSVQPRVPPGRQPGPIRTCMTTLVPPRERGIIQYRSRRQARIDRHGAWWCNNLPRYQGQTRQKPVTLHHCQQRADVHGETWSCSIRWHIRNQMHAYLGPNRCLSCRNRATTSYLRLFCVLVYVLPATRLLMQRRQDHKLGTYSPVDSVICSLLLGGCQQDGHFVVRVTRRSSSQEWHPY